MDVERHKEDFLGYRCSVCQGEYLPGAVTYVCPRDGGNLDVVLDMARVAREIDPGKITRSPEPSLWRYVPLLPVADPGCAGTPLRAAGWTPVFAPPALSRAAGLARLWLKDESRNPTASFKDRASAVVVARAIQTGAGTIVTASTGNAGAALAGMAAAAGHPAVILVPRTAPPAKVAQLQVYGARVALIEGSYDDAFDLTITAAEEFGWYCRNTGYNPFTAEGKKTAAFEIWEQVLLQSRLDRPLCVFVSVGDGNIIAGIHKGFRDLHTLGWLEYMPRLFGVQAAGSAAVANAFATGEETIRPVRAETIADSISVDLPRDGLRAVRAARETRGAYLVVTDEQILAAISTLGKAGVFAEPAGAAAWAGLLEARARGLVLPEDPVLVLNTGSGLKDVRAAIRSAICATGEPAVIEPSLGALRRLLRV
jgi:threonine synthase